MTYTTRELTSAAPVELYLFQLEGTCWAYTSADVVVTHGGYDFQPVSIERSDLSATEELSATLLDISLDRTLSLAQIFATGVPPVPVTVLLQRLHRGDTDAATLFNGEVSGAILRRGHVLLRCGSLQSKAERKLPRIVLQKTCNHILYDDFCGVPKDQVAFRYDGTISAVNGLNVTIPGLTAAIPISPAPMLASISGAAWAAMQDVYWEGGYIVVGSHKAYIQKYSSSGAPNVVTLLNGIPGLDPAEDVIVYAGCDRFISTCLYKFNNVPNFMGFPFIPDRNPFTSGILKA